jgi:ApaG protein
MIRLSKSNKPLENNLYNLSEPILNRPYTATTDDIQITVWPEFVDSKSSVVGDLFIWAYHVRIDNKTSASVKLINRYWRIIDEKGIVQEVNGEGVIGEQPLIAVNSFYQYSSGVHLRYPSGIMNGKYQMQKENGEIFDVAIPTFSLDVPSSQSVVN